MTPKEKAIELVTKFESVGLQRRDEGISCALICVDEMINITPMYIGVLNPRWEYLQDVQLEIQLL